MPLPCESSLQAERKHQQQALKVSSAGCSRAGTCCQQQKQPVEARKAGGQQVGAWAWSCCDKELLRIEVEASACTGNCCRLVDS